MSIRVQPVFFLYLAALAVFSSIGDCLSAAVALAVHEYAHWKVAKWLGETIDSITLTPFGGVMTYAKGKSPSKGLKGIAVAAAGPLGNYLFIIVLSALGAKYQELASIAPSLIRANTSMMLLNLLPVLPLDGGRILFSAGYFVAGASGLIRLLSALGIALGALFTGVAIYGAVKLGVVNLSVLIVGLYIIALAIRSRDTMLTENLYAVVQERWDRKTPIQATRVYSVQADTGVFELLGLIERSKASVFIFEDTSGRHWIGERELLGALLQDLPDVTVAQAAGITGNKEKSVR